MKIETEILKKLLLSGSVVLLVSAVIIYKIFFGSTELRMVQIMDDNLQPLTAKDVSVVDYHGSRWPPDNAGIVRVPVGLLTVADPGGIKIYIIVQIPEEGPSPYQVIVPGFVKTK
jgi:hypothetical protein